MLHQSLVLSIVSTFINAIDKPLWIVFTLVEMYPSQPDRQAELQQSIDAMQTGEASQVIAGEECPFLEEDERGHPFCMEQVLVG